MAFTDLCGMPPALFALAIGADGAQVGNIDLCSHVLQDSGGHGHRVFEEGAQESHRRELQRKTQTAAVAPLAGDPFAIVIVEMEVACQVVDRQ